MSDLSRTIQEFTTAMLAAGLLSEDAIVADGAIHAFHVDGDRRGTKNGRYQLHADGHPAGWFGTHKQALWHRWTATRSTEPTPAERAAYARRLALLKAARDVERQAAQDAAEARSGPVASRKARDRGSSLSGA